MIKKDSVDEGKKFEDIASDSIALRVAHDRIEMKSLPYMFIRGTNHIFLVCSYDISGKFKQ